MPFSGQHLPDHCGDIGCRIGIGQGPHLLGHGVPCLPIADQRQQSGGKRLFGTLFRIALIEKIARTGIDKHFGVLTLMIVGRVRVGNEKGRYTAHGQFGQRRSAGTADGRVAGRQCLGDVHNEGVDGGVDPQTPVDGRRRLVIVVPRLMDDTPPGKLLLDLGKRQGHVGIQPSGAATSAQHEQLLRPLDGRRFDRPG